MAEQLNFGKRYEDDRSFYSDPIRFRFVELFQVGELSCEAGFEIEPHVQQLFEVTYVAAGKGTVYTDGHAYPVEDNSVFINIPGQTHSIRADRGTPLHFCYLGFSFLGSYNADPGLERFYRSWNGSMVFRDKSLLVLFLRILEEFREQRDGYLTMVGAYAEQLVMEVYRCFEELSGLRTLAGEHRAGDAAFAVVQYVDRHYRDIEDIRELSAQLGYSYTYLAHIFKDKIGVTIGSYIIAKKMEEAKWLLRTGRISVSQIAARFNYRSVQSFSNSFKKAVGMSPADYQALPVSALAGLRTDKDGT